MRADAPPLAPKKKGGSKMIAHRQGRCGYLVAAVALLALTTGLAAAPRLASHMYRIYSKSVSVCSDGNQSHIEREIASATQRGARLGPLQAYPTCFDKMVHVYTALYAAEQENSSDGSFVIVMFLMMLAVVCFLQK